MSAEEMTPQERTKRAAGLFMEMLRTLPTAYAQLTLSREELAERERAGQELGAQLHELVSDPE